MNMDRLLDETRGFVRDLDPSGLPEDVALRLVEQFAELEKLAVAGRTVVAGRVVKTLAWRSTGATSAVTWMASRAGTTLTQAAATLETSLRLDELPVTRDALVSGKLSEVQATEIAAAAAAVPDVERQLVRMASYEGVAKLREKCRDLRAAATGDEDARERIRRSRYFRHWTDRDGALRFDARMAPDDGAPLLAVMRARADRLQADARRAGQKEPAEAYAADALCSLGDGVGAPKAVVQVVVSREAFERGHTEPGETCQIPGVGPITVGAARKLAARGSVKVIGTDGVDVTRVAHARRTIPAHLRSAVEARDIECAVPGCNRRRDLEIDHIVPFAAGGPTSLDNLVRLCKWHHAQKTHHGWSLEGAPGAREWVFRGRRGTARRE